MEFLTNTISASPRRSLPTFIKNTLADRIIFQMDQAEFACETVFRTAGEHRSEPQIWIAIVFLLKAILRKRLKIDHSMAEIQHIINPIQFENPPMITLFSDDSNTLPRPALTKAFLPGFNATVVICHTT
ncbi:MAG: hypothetical protein Q4C95_08715 [Planctomycetia bacterium]|nr:hypothetical protein [Planctomycetia bacterium]